MVPYSADLMESGSVEQLAASMVVPTVELKEPKMDLESVVCLENVLVDETVVLLARVLVAWKVLRTVVWLASKMAAL